MVKPNVSLTYVHKQLNKDAQLYSYLFRVSNVVYACIATAKTVFSSCWNDFICIICNISGIARVDAGIIFSVQPIICCVIYVNILL